MLPNRRQRWAAFGAIVILASHPARAQWPAIDAPNFVPISESLATSGQPSAATLAGLKRIGVEAVISLGPRAGPDLVPEEPALVRGQGIEFIYLPFPPDGPSETQYLAVAEALRRVQGRRTLVHCQVNWQASTFVFLYRVIVGKESPSLAYAPVASVWSPPGPWKELLMTQLRKHQIDFEPY
ncbi:MAG: protein tyrosine phosphatase family protein [Burkholderiaceae bacterium]|nr:protein tyrosine phosphatase family protein [Burkholderiaceae bacterium]